VRPRLTRAYLICAAALLFWAADAPSYDQQVASNLWAEGYSVYSPDGAVIRRRRFVEDLYLGAWNLLPGSGDPYYRGPRFSLEVSLRLDTDFGVGRYESRPSSESSFAPGVTPVQMDAVIAYMDARGLWRGALDLRAGRQIRLDTLGFFAFDGFETRLHVPIGAELDTYFGYEVRGGQVLGYDSFELDGTDSGGRHGMEEDRYPDRTEPKPRLAIGAELSVNPWSWLDAAVGFRAVGLSQPLADERVGGRMTLGAKPVWADAGIVWSPLVRRMNEVNARLTAAPWDRVALALDYNLYRPVFEGDSIFNVFDLSDQNDVCGRVDVRFDERISSAAWGCARLADESAGLSGDASDEMVAGAVGGVGGNYRTPLNELSARFSMVQEWGENRVGGEIGMGRGFFRGQRLWLRLRFSVWHIDDMFSEYFSGNLGGYVVSARFRIADGAYLLGEFEHYAGNERDQRFFVLALLQLDLWR
jgi:hypothetical protein